MIRKKVIILYTANFCLKMQNLYDIKRLIREFDVEFWNLSAITAKEHLSPVFVEGLIEIEVKTHRQLDRLIRRNKRNSPVYFTVMGLAPFSIGVYCLLTLYRCKICYVTSGTLPAVPLNPSANPDADRNLIAKFRRASWSQIFRALKLRLFWHSPLIKAADFVMWSCAKATVFTKTAKKTVFVNSNAGDYQSYLELRERETISPLPGRYLVFLDQYAPFHQDYMLLGLKQMGAKEYFGQLLPFFDDIEAQTGCEIVIAAHPSAERYRHENYFAGRKIFFNMSGILVKHSEGAITHNTTAVAFPVLFKKPLLYVAMNEMCDYDKRMAELMAADTGSPLLTLPQDCFTGFQAINEEKYAQYKGKYLSALPEDRVSNADVIRSVVERIA